MEKENGEKITIDQLAIIINNGFNGQMAYMEKKFEQIEQKMATKEQVQKLEVKVDKIDERLKHVETVLTDAHVL
ncbi:MAG: hypothetical protein A2528_02505 [Candidatus Staskawiczbacteria bacterium RIFOXYD2_FULL_37_9]|uniref:Uncharacterized protein n=1 Tax=Candidatus Staskawiczbacteria bacterium RIFOXYB1_FULL_37_44 TaxID=1802223 RepID=A0A1G2IYG0_9BACT|nr:MAG: hypothetical protein A2358_04215 [Candidatus Staskawiczbacteria bacterium RIFOXYB1_FULL_37_44]OGZ83521.1 MAG: hypothetical protein A2416_01160 [Candidatus Staskawiczbacteria bacterium RIFOXYC1_FULL_37_52]OGZ88586.1 MAG: hypothetical protein A2444_01680 [Candidatus Staskawiczbacteria bacterium RIFOXYC2_FULL_37_19]OGZ89471.1 MAG: hypothetical protein A2581_03900 [Candidatus Staskawiczbacteria bacterium RIFOXYD1_FULL_37_110]OGZ93922.1 MAG: hypothetical protein A2528_02505 [Candidatus Stask